MEYTIDDLRGKWVKTGTPEAEVFLDVCEVLGVLWNNGVEPRREHPISEYFSLKHNGFLCSGVPVNCNKPFTPKQQWSIYTNDKPLCELSDEQAAALFNAWRKGCVMQSKNNSGWCDLPTKTRSWYGENTYRIKQKSECELFVDEVFSHYKGDTLFDNSVTEMLESAFKSGKFKMVEGNNK